MSSIIEIENVSKIYRLYRNHNDRLKEIFMKKKYHSDFYALKNISLSVNHNEIIGVIGGNGAGKSTLLKILGGIVVPTEGSVDVKGRVSSLIELGTGFNQELSGVENIYFGGAIMGFSKEEIDEFIDDILAFADIGEHIYQPLKNYSSGMYARLAFSLAVMIDPEILIVDEILSVGDKEFKQKSYEKMKTMIESKTIVYVSHDMDKVQELCSRAIWLKNGVVMAEGDPKAVCATYFDWGRYNVFIPHWKSDPVGSEEISKSYHPSQFEESIYQLWLDKKVFEPVFHHGVKPYVMVMPPPNVTGALHMGHGLNGTLQDLLARYYRMEGRPTLWLPGTDHAGIATQFIVEKILKEERGVSRHDLGREAFLKEAWKVKENHHSIILEQMKKVGFSCDWSRERFTMDEGLSSAVREVFVSLYERGLVYKGKYLVNWCTTCQTALADDEVDHKDFDGKLYYLSYPLSDGSGKITIATTRPETMLGDTAVAVHPDDERYTAYHSKSVKLPLTEREIPVVCDSYCNREFGSGAVKITPGHDPNDREIGERHALPAINILNEEGTLNENVPKAYRGLTVTEARKRVVEALEKEGLLEKSEDHKQQLGQCYRCSTTVEPLLSEQWFVKMRPLAEKALNALEVGDIHFYPKRWENTYVNWLKNIRDWCISRQLWWGHRIPVWYCDTCSHMIVARENPTKCSECGSSSLTQESDVLDTWFSSWLWPFSTLGWPKKTEDLKSFFPTTTLVTAYDIIFFWVARMIMASLEFMGKSPFTDIYITPLIRDKQGRKMSKSLGNGIDPLDAVDLYGSDAIRFTLFYLSAQGQDISLDMDTFKLGSRFCNKVWNASRFIFQNMEKNSYKIKTIRKIDRWIFHRLNSCIRAVQKGIKQYRFDEATHAVYNFFWSDFCDWYLEGCKSGLYSDSQKERDETISFLLFVFKETLKLLHPFIPFLSEELFQKLSQKTGEQGIVATELYPQVRKDWDAPLVEEEFSNLQELVRAVRTVRSEFNIPPTQRISVTVSSKESRVLKFFEEESSLIKAFINIEDLSFRADKPKEKSVTTIGRKFEAHLSILDMIDREKEIGRIRKNLASNEKLKSQSEGKLNNPSFTKKAPQSIIDKEQEKLKEFSSAIKRLKGYLESMEQSE